MIDFPIFFNTVFILTPSSNKRIGDAENLINPAAFNRVNTVYLKPE